MAGAVGDLVKSPANAVDNVRTGPTDLHRTASSLGVTPWASQLRP